MPSVKHSEMWLTCWTTAWEICGSGQTPDSCGRKRGALDALARRETDIVPFRVYGAADGLPTRECSQGSQPAACRTADGTLWFADRSAAWPMFSPPRSCSTPIRRRLSSNPFRWMAHLQHSKTLRRADSRVPGDSRAARKASRSAIPALNLSAPEREPVPVPIGGT